MGVQTHLISAGGTRQQCSAGALAFSLPFITRAGPCGHGLPARGLMNMADVAGSKALQLRTLATCQPYLSAPGATFPRFTTRYRLSLMLGYRAIWAAW